MSQTDTAGLVDTTGRPLRATAAQPMTAYRAADRLSQELAAWGPGLLSADAAYLPERDGMVARIRDTARNSGWASGAVTRLVDQAIGAQFRLLAKPDYQALGLDAEWSYEWTKQVEAEFRGWADDPRCYCDAGERHNLTGLLGLLFRHVAWDGECLALPQWIERPNGRYRTAIQVVDPDRLSNPDGRFDDGHLRGGVELNRFGAPVAYHIRQRHPGEWLGTMGAAEAYAWQRVPRRTAWGRLRVIHHFEPDRAGQTRGISRFVQTLEKLRVLDRYERTELQAAIVNAVFAAFIESPFDQSLVEDSLGADGEGLSAYSDMRAEFHRDQPVRLDGVKVPILAPGEKIGTVKSERPNAAFADFERTALRYVAAALGQSYEQLAQDWSSTNYSSARAALLEFWKFLTARRGHFVTGVANPIYALWLEEAVERGTVDLPEGAPGFWAAPAAWTRCRWVGPGRGWIDPTKEAQASLMRMDAGISTLEHECAEQGLDHEEVMEQQARERQRRAELGLDETTWAVISESPIEADPDEADRRERQSSARGRRFVDTDPDTGEETVYERRPAGRLAAYEARMAALRARAADRANAVRT